MKALPQVIGLAVLCFLAACTPQAPIISTGIASQTPGGSSTLTLPNLLTRPTLTPTPAQTPTNLPTPTPAVTLYNRYIGKNAERQPELIQTPFGPIIPISSASGYPNSYFANNWAGNQVNGDPIRGDPIMLEHLILLFNDAFKAGHSVETVLSSYRTYAEQVYLRQVDSEANDKFLAAPGRSEHHLGTAVDLAWQTERLNFNVMNVYPRARAFYDYLKGNAQRFGFIFSYPFKSNPNQSKTNLLEPYITEYKAEPWHIRYVGSELAEMIYAIHDDQGRNYLDPLSELIPQQFMLPK